MGVGRAMISTSTHLLSASKLPTAINDIMQFSDDEYNCDNYVSDFRRLIQSVKNNADTQLDWL